MNIDLTVLLRRGVASCFGLLSPDLGGRGQPVAMPCRQALVGMAGLTLLLAGLGIGGEVGAQTPEPMPSSATVSDSAEIEDYCAALNISASDCARLSSIVFSRTGEGDIRWDETHGSSPMGGGMSSVLSPVVGAGDYSCMSLNFNPPLPANLDISFYWALSRGGGSGSTHMQLFVAPPEGHVPMVTTGTADFIRRSANGYSPWMSYSVARVNAPIPELKWCYFGSNTQPVDGDQGRLDLLYLSALSSVTDRTVIARYCTALNIPGEQCSRVNRLGFAGPLRLDDLAWDSTHTGSPPAGGGISVASPIVSRSEYSCMSIYFRPDIPQNEEISFEWDLNREDGDAQSALFRYYEYYKNEGDDSIPSRGPSDWRAERALGSGSVSGFAGWNINRRRLGEPIRELRWCYFGANATAEARDQGRIDRLIFGPEGSSGEESVSEAVVLAEYCTALNMAEQFCERLSSIVFSGTIDFNEESHDAARLPWDDMHGDAPVGGGARSVLSPVVIRGSYRCMSLRFSPPIAMSSDISFDWSVGRDSQNSNDDNAHLQLFVAPPDDHVPTATEDKADRFIQRSANGFSAWTSHSVRRVSAPVPELKWCYFGADFGAGAEARGRIDRLALIVLSSTEDRTVIDRYCAALNVPGEQCSGISRLGFASPFRLKDFGWDIAHAEGAPAGGGVSVASPMVSKGEYSCISVYFDPPLPEGRKIAFEWDLNRGVRPMGAKTQAFLRFHFFAPGEGDHRSPYNSDGDLERGNARRSLGRAKARGFDGWEAVRETLSKEVGELRWCYLGDTAIAGDRDQGRIDRLAFGPADNGDEESFSETAVLAQYCTALNMSNLLCDRLSGIVFSGTEVDRLPWDDRHGGAPVGGGDHSVLSPAVSAGNYSCMSLRLALRSPWARFFSSTGLSVGTK